MTLPRPSYIWVPLKIPGTTELRPSCMIMQLAGTPMTIRLLSRCQTSQLKFRSNAIYWAAWPGSRSFRWMPNMLRGHSATQHRCALTGHQLCRGENTFCMGCVHQVIRSSEFDLACHVFAVKLSFLLKHFFISLSFHTFPASLMPTLCLFSLITTSRFAVTLRSRCSIWVTPGPHNVGFLTRLLLCGG